MKHGKRRALDKDKPVDALLEQMEHAKAEHPLRVIKRQFGHLKVRYRGLIKNTQQLHRH